MKLTKKEQEICDEYDKFDEEGRCRCFECPLLIDRQNCECYATVDGRSAEARKLKRL